MSTQHTTSPASQPGTPQATPSRGPRERPRSWPVPAALLALAAIPLTAGTLRLVQLPGGPAIIPADHRFASFPLPLVLHIIGATTYAMVGAFQFVPRLRRRHLAWHRRAGRVLTLAGLMVAGSALWMTLFSTPQPGTGHLLYVLRLGFGSAMAACLVLGFTAIRRRAIAAHQAWVIRAYAIALAAGTQAFTGGIGAAAFGTGELQGDLAQGAGWLSTLRSPSGSSADRPRPAPGVATSHNPPQWPPPAQAHRHDHPPKLTPSAELPITYKFRLSGHLDDRWSDWFGGHTLVRNDDASTTLTVEVADQAHLHGLLAGIHDLGVTLLSLNRDDAAADASRCAGSGHPGQVSHDMPD